MNEWRQTETGRSPSASTAPELSRLTTMIVMLSNSMRKMWASGLKYNWKDGGSSTIKTELVEDKWSVEFYTVGVKAWVEALEWC